ncbi:hemolysin XhlA family protein [bacterium]|nr:hemolysin XhlA family protein [bacterium]MBU1983233.1 hemolysin XhlA family protein [bacterium]
MSDSSFDRSLGRVEARVADLTEQITRLRSELSRLVQLVESSTAAHHERIRTLESFRRWAIGLLTGLFLSGVAAVFAYVSRM